MRRTTPRSETTNGQHRRVFATTTTRTVAALAVRAVTRELDYATWR